MRDVLAGTMSVSARADVGAVAARPKPRLAALTGVRFVAAMHVLLYHRYQALLAEQGAPAWIRNIVGTGYIGVGLFFVLSGFILSYNYLEGDRPIDRRGFVAARFARIYPVYILGILVALPWYLMAVARLPDAIEVRTAATTIALTAGLAQSWSPDHACALNCPGWSLSGEAFFYLVFLLIAPALWRLSTRATVIAAIVTWSLALLPPALYLALAPDGAAAVSAGTNAFWINLVKYNPLLRLPEFILGILAARLYARGRAIPERFGAAASILIVLIIGAVLAASPSLPYPLLHNGLLAILFAALVLALATGKGPVAAVLAMPLLLLLGEASYALYILHQPLYFWVHDAMQRFGIPIRASVPGLALYTAITIATSILVLKRIEEPARRALRRRLANPFHSHPLFLIIPRP